MLAVYDTSYTDAATFKTAMSGVKLIYELATPLVYTLDEPIPATYVNYAGGTIMQLPQNGSEPTTAPMRMSYSTAVDIVSEYNKMPENYISKVSMQNILNAFVSAGIIASYTLTYDSTNQRYTCSITAPSTE